MTRKIHQFLEEGLIAPPACRFPRIWAPPEYFLVVSLLEIRKNKPRVHSALITDPHVFMIVKANTGRYNLVTFSTFHRMEKHLSWEEDFDRRFQGSIGAVKNLYLSPLMTFSIQQQFVSLTYLEKRLAKIHGEQLQRTMKM